MENYALTEATPDKYNALANNNRAIGSYEWERLFNAAKDILKSEVHQKGDTSVSYGVTSTPKMVKLAQELCVELLKLASENLKTVTTIH